MLSRCAIAFLPRSKCLLILWLQSPSAVILESKKVMSVTLNNTGLFSSSQVSFNRILSFLKLSILQTSAKIVPNLKIRILKAQSFSSSDSKLQTDFNIIYINKCNISTQCVGYMAVEEAWGRLALYTYTFILLDSRFGK